MMTPVHENTTYLSQSDLNSNTELSSMIDDCDYLNYEQEVMERVLRMHEEFIHSPDRDVSDSSGRSEDIDRDRGSFKE